MAGGPTLKETWRITKTAPAIEESTMVRASIDLRTAALEAVELEANTATHVGVDVEDRVVEVAVALKGVLFHPVLGRSLGTWLSASNLFTCDLTSYQGRSANPEAGSNHRDT
jgi:hypothetical protein